MSAAVFKLSSGEQVPYLDADEKPIAADVARRLSSPEQVAARDRGLKRYWREKGKQEGFAEGHEQGVQVGIEQGRADFQPYVARAVEVFDKTRSREEQKHGRFRFYQGMVLGGLGGIAIAGLAYSMAMWATVSQMTDVFNRATVNGMVMATQAHSAPCVPGAALQDGTRCPQPVAP